MITIIVDGSLIRDNLLKKYLNDINTNNYEMKLAIICVDPDDASIIYIKNKKRICNLMNIKTDIYKFNKKQKIELIDLIKKLNVDDSVTGIMVELPLPNGFNKEEIYSLINPAKDVDGLCVNSKVTPCTALAVLEIINHFKIDTNKNILLIGYSDLIGKPLNTYFKEKNIVCTICNSKTENLKEHTLKADIIITAVGRKNLITEDMIKNNTVIIDCGIVKINGKIYGDIDFNNVKGKCKLITPVPNGVGPITTAMVINNLLLLYKK